MMVGKLCSADDEPVRRGGEMDVVVVGPVFGLHWVRDRKWKAKRARKNEALVGIWYHILNSGARERPIGLSIEQPKPLGRE
jgi:hypothetical protein